MKVLPFALGGAPGLPPCPPKPLPMNSKANLSSSWKFQLPAHLGGPVSDGEALLSWAYGGTGGQEVSSLSPAVGQRKRTVFRFNEAS
jgi:hypothetical protein